MNVLVSVAKHRSVASLKQLMLYRLGRPHFLTPQTAPKRRLSFSRSCRRSRVAATPC